MLSRQNILRGTSAGAGVRALASFECTPDKERPAMSDEKPIDIQSFAALAAQRGLQMESDDMVERLYAGYCALQDHLARLPAKPDPGTDPALLFLVDGAGISK